MPATIAQLAARFQRGEHAVTRSDPGTTAQSDGGEILAERAQCEALVRAHERMLLTYCTSIVRDRELAEDICQDAFLRAFRSLATLRDVEAMPAWLRTIARNLAIDALKKRGHDVHVDARVLDAIDATTAAIHDDRETATARIGFVQQCLETLPAPLRDACRLLYFDNLTPPDIAIRLGASLAAVAKRLQRAREQLGECLRRKLGLDSA